MKYKPVKSVTLPPKGKRDWSPGVPAGQWRPSRGVSGVATATVGCEDCGEWLYLKEHTVHENGRVSPSIGCPVCGWHVFATLDQWQERRLEDKYNNGS